MPESVPRRPLLHLTPDRGFMNDPNGLVQHRGRHHVFFQHNPEGPEFGRMHWGHAVSDDLLGWTQLPSALVPGAEGDYDRDGCWSGCHLTAPDGTPAVLYSGRADDRELPCLALAVDDELTGWRRHPDNPVVPAPPEPVTAFRDHTVLATPDGYRQWVGGGTVARRGALFGYRSADLVDWSYEGVVLDAAGHDLPGDIWECPDHFVVSGHPVLLVSLIGPEPDVLWLLGDPQAPGFVPVAYGRLDLGPRFYAPQTYLADDGRRLMFGWLREQHEPSVTGRTRIGVMSLPRVIDVRDGRVVSRPAEEVLRARAGLVRTARGGLAGHRPDGPAFEVELLAQSPADLAATRVTLTGPGGSLALDLAELAGRPAALQRVDGHWQPSGAEPGSARLLVDTGIVELFLDDGRCAAWTRVDLDPVDGLEVLATAGTEVRVHRLDPSATQRS